MVRTYAHRQPAGPPATAEAGAALVRDYVVKLYDRQDGQGVDWQKIAGTLFRASFDVLDELPAAQRRAVAGRAHERSYEAMTADPAARRPAADQTPAAPSHTGGMKSPRPKGPR